MTADASSTITVRRASHEPPSRPGDGASPAGSDPLQDLFARRALRRSAEFSQGVLGERHSREPARAFRVRWRSSGTLRIWSGFMHTAYSHTICMHDLVEHDRPAAVDEHAVLEVGAHGARRARPPRGRGPCAGDRDRVAVADRARRPGR